MRVSTVFVSCFSSAGLPMFAQSIVATSVSSPTFSLAALMRWLLEIAKRPVSVTNSIGTDLPQVIIPHTLYSHLHPLPRSYLHPYNMGRFFNNSEICTRISKQLSIENKAKLSQLETQNISSAVLFICNFQLREFRLVLYR